MDRTLDLRDPLEQAEPRHGPADAVGAQDPELARELEVRRGVLIAAIVAVLAGVPAGAAPRASQARQGAGRRPPRGGRRAGRQGRLCRRRREVRDGARLHPRRCFPPLRPRLHLFASQPARGRGRPVQARARGRGAHVPGVSARPPVAGERGRAPRRRPAQADARRHVGAVPRADPARAPDGRSAARSNGRASRRGAGGCPYGSP